MSDGLRNEALRNEGPHDASGNDAPGEDAFSDDGPEQNKLEDAWEDDALEDDGPVRSPRGGLNGRTLIRMVIGGLVLVVAAVLLVSHVQGPGTPSDNSAAAGLARDMLDHHAQAVDMATIVQRRTTNAQIRYLATDIALTQTNQMGQMQGWLNVWGLPIGRSGQPMQWMAGHEAEHALSNVASGSTQLGANGLMPGMATQADVNKLSSLPVDQADILFLQLMIKHHQGGVGMAQAALDLSDVPVVRNLCTTIVNSQTLEITQMQTLLRQLQAG